MQAPSPTPRQANPAKLGASFHNMVNTKLGCIADADAYAEEQVAKHAAPRLLAVVCSTLQTSPFLPPTREYHYRTDLLRARSSKHGVMRATTSAQKLQLVPNRRESRRRKLAFLIIWLQAG